jgi:hypothetical protein
MVHFMGIPHFETGPYMKISQNSPQNWFFSNFFPENHHLENAQNNGFLMVSTAFFPKKPLSDSAGGDCRH